MKRFCVFCVSSPGQRQSSARSVKGLGKDPAHQNIGLILGGGKVSDMVINANTALENGGEVISGIIK